MNFSVDWTEEALSQLAAIWHFSPNRQAVAQAQITVDRLLALDPKGKGDHLSEGLYAINVSMLRVKYEIAEADRVVTVVAVQELT